jgi:hypothetical protein
MKKKQYWKKRTWLSQVLLILAMMYSVSSINILLMALGVVRWIPQAYLNPKVLTWFSIISYGFAMLLAVYHFGVFFFGRRRKTDDEEPAR